MLSGPGFSWGFKLIKVFFRESMILFQAKAIDAVSNPLHERSDILLILHICRFCLCQCKLVDFQLHLLYISKLISTAFILYTKERRTQEISCYKSCWVHTISFVLLYMLYACYICVCFFFFFLIINFCKLILYQRY